MAEKDTDWMQICLDLGRQARQAGNAAVGAVIVADDQLIGAGMEAGKSKKDITCHAEIEAIRDALQRGHSNLSAAVLYTTHEPCLMCSYVIRHHRIARIVMGVPVPEVGGYTSPFPILTTQLVSKWGPPPAITMGVLKKECEALSGHG
jgi:tRNA(adenine34) deaminase